MKRTDWNHFFQTVYWPVFAGEKCYVDRKLVSPERYPALKELRHLSTLEVLILAWLIDLDSLSQCNEWHSLSSVEELFENYDGAADMIDGVHNLLADDLIEMNFPKSKRARTQLRANIYGLWQRHLLTTPNDCLLRSDKGKCSLLAKNLMN